MAINLDVHGNTQPLEAAVQAAVNRIRRNPIKVTVDDKGATQPLGNMKRGADEFSKSMEAANARIIAFGASMAIMNGVANSFKAVVKNAVEVEKALADINVVMGLTASNLDRFSDGLFKVAKETGAAFNIAAQAATEYARQGLSVEESLKRTRDALILTRLTGMDSAQGVKALTAAMNTYGKEIKDTTQLVSKFAAVDVKFAVSAEDFADAIARTGQAAKSAGVSIDELIGLVTAAQQQTARGGKVIGNSFKTIFTRIGRTDTLNQLENLGIAVRDLEGNTLGAKRILTDLANSFDHLSEAQKAQIAQTVGGVFQINVLKAVLSDAAKQNGILANATQISAGATDEAIQKNEQLRQTMAAMATETGLALKDISARVGEIMLGPGIEKILNVVKSIADGANNLLGDGESAGSKFANGFLKGIGNIITGPGLVVITVVFGKLFLKAAQFAKESLVSLIGVTSEAQKQKAIQSSLVALFGRSAALSKEMLSTSTTKAQKEQIILNLLKAQVAEAQMLDSVAKRAASTLYKQGYNAGLAPRGGRRGASGYIPNFAHPERQEAAQGGYAAGNIRSMNMPGAGSVIYNSAEKVKNFAGFTQPAIMPPLSSKAGKNYQQAFGDVHGFDPYAGSGYIPNFNKKVAFGDAAEMKGYHIADMLIPQIKSRSSPSSGLPKPAEREKIARRFGINLNTTKGKALVNKKVLFNIHGVNPKGINEVTEDEYGGLKEKLESSVANAVVNYANALQLGPGISATAVKSVQQEVFPAKGDATGASGALGSVYGAVFEKALELRFETEASEREVPGGDFDVAVPNEYIKELFGLEKSAAKGIADIKASAKPDNRNSMAEKILKEVLSKDKAVMTGALKNQSIAGRFAVARGATANNPLGYSTRTPKGNARGYIPNFVDPLSDAIGREKGAGVPVSQIRVGTHQSLIGKGNPLGIGVTNTKDEPNGLKDVFGANGYVPNYSLMSGAMDFARGYGMGMDKTVMDNYKKTLSQLTTQLQQNNSAQKSAKAEITRLTKARRAQNLTSQQLQKIDRELLAAQQRQQKLTVQHNAIQQKQNTVQQSLGGKAGQMGAGMAGKFDGMGLMAMIGLPMIAGQLQQGGPGQGNSAAYAAGGALTGAASGGMMASMVAPFFGPFAPLVIGVGALGGALHGAMGAIEENSAALAENSNKLALEKDKAFDDKMNRMIGGLARTVGTKAAAATYKPTMKISTSEQDFGEGFTDANFFGGTAAANDKDKKVLRDSLFTVLRAGKGKAAADFFGLDTDGSGLTDNIEFTKENEGEWLDFRDEVVDPESVIKGILNRTITEQGAVGAGNIMDGYGSELLGKQDESRLPEELVKKNQEAIREAYLTQLRSTDQGRDFLERMRKQKQFKGDYNAAFGGLGDEFKDPKNLLQAMSVMGRKDVFGEQEDPDLRMRRIATGKDMAKKYIGLLGNDGTATIENDKGEVEEVTGEQMKKMLEQAEATGRIIPFLKKLGISTRKMSEEQDRMTKGTIISLRLQKAQQTAQRKAKENQIKIASQFSEESLRLKNQQNMHGKFMSRREKAENKYAESLNQLSKKLAQTKFNADAAFESTIIGAIKGDAPLASAIKTALAKGAKGEELSDIDVTDKYANMSLKEKIALLQRIKKENRENTGLSRVINDLIEKANDIRTDAVHLANQEFNSKKGLLEMERDINIENDKRLDKVDQLIHKNKMLELSVESRLQTLKEANQEEDNTVTASGLGLSKHDALAQNLARARERMMIQRDQNKAKRIDFLSGKSGDIDFSADEIEKISSGKMSIADAAKRKDPRLLDSESKARMNEINSLQQKIQSEPGPYADYEKDVEQLDALTVQARKLDSDFEKYTQKVKELSGEFENLNAKLSDDEEGPYKKAKAELKGYENSQKFTTGLKAGFQEIQTQTKFIEANLGKRIPNMLRDGLAEAMGAAINGAEDLDDVLRGVAMGFLQTIQQAMLQKAAGHMIGAMGFSKGGQVPGRVPAMVTNGEYIMNKDAVNKYGGGFMHSLNARGRLPSYSTGGPHKESAIGMNFAGSEGFQTGRRYQSEKMSGFFYSGQAGNVGLQEDTSSAREIIQERIRRREEKKAKKRALMKQIVGTILSVGISHGIGSMMNSAASSSAEGMMSAQGIPEGSAEYLAQQNNIPVQQAQSMLLNSKMNNVPLPAQFTTHLPAGVQGPPMSGPVNLGNQTSASLLGAPVSGSGGMQSSRSTGLFGGFVENMFGPGSSSSSYWGSSQKAKDYRANIPQEDIDAYKRKHGAGFFASGGFVSGKSGIDQIPAMLSEGEYVIKASSARRLGPQTLNAINTGRFNDGGAVTPISEKTESGISGGNTNNISISVNIDKSGGTSEEKSDSKSSDPKKASDDQTKEKALSEKLKEQVVATILEEQRPGGLLAKD